MTVILSLGSPPPGCGHGDICVAVHGDMGNERSRRRMLETAVRIALLVGEEAMLIFGAEGPDDAKLVAWIAVEAMKRGICIRVQGLGEVDTIQEACRAVRKTSEAWLEPIAAAVERTLSTTAKTGRVLRTVRSSAPAMLRYYIDYVGSTAEACRRIEERYVANISKGESIRSAWKRFISEEKGFLEFLSRIGMGVSFSTFYRAISKIMNEGCEEDKPL